MSGREHALNLIKQRDTLEAEIEQTLNELSAHKVTRDEPLVSADGFPRHDVDVATVRQLRVKLIRLENDLKALLDEISTSLKTAFPPKRESQLKPSQPKPFCEVRSVVSGSLSDEAGIEAGDQIIKFGSTNLMAQLALELRELIDKGEELNIVIKRPKTQQNLEFSIKVSKQRPLGCHIVPL